MDNRTLFGQQNVHQRKYPVDTARILYFNVSRVPITTGKSIL